MAPRDPTTKALSRSVARSTELKLGLDMRRVLTRGRPTLPVFAPQFAPRQPKAAHSGSGFITGDRLGLVTVVRLSQPEPGRGNPQPADRSRLHRCFPRVADMRSRARVSAVALDIWRHSDPGVFAVLPD